MSNSLWPHELQHPRLPCLSLSPGVCLNSCSLSQWCYLAIPSSVTPFSSCLQSFPASEFFFFFFPPNKLALLNRWPKYRSFSFSISPCNYEFWSSKIFKTIFYSRMQNLRRNSLCTERQSQENSQDISSRPPHTSISELVDFTLSSFPVPLTSAPLPAWLHESRLPYFPRKYYTNLFKGTYGSRSPFFYLIHSFFTDPENFPEYKYGYVTPLFTKHSASYQVLLRQAMVLTWPIRLMQTNPSLHHKIPPGPSGHWTWVGLTWEKPCSFFPQHYEVCQCCLFCVLAEPTLTCWPS